MSVTDQNVMEFMTATNTRLDSLEQSLQGIEPSLKFLHENLSFFQSLVSSLHPRISSLENAASKIPLLENSVLTGLPALIEKQADLSKKDIVNEAAMLTQEALRPDLQVLQKSIDDFRRDATANFASKSDVENAQLSAAATLPRGPMNKSKVPPPSEFTGKREDWKTFSSHLSLFFTANANQYPTDADKILFSISRLGGGPAFKYMEQYIPDFAKPTESRPLIIASYTTFISTLSENFGIQNAHIVAEAQLRSLKQKGSAMDYTNKFLELASETDWNDSAKISQYRLGLKDAVQDILALTDEPTDFATFTSKAINVDKRLYARQVEKQNGNNSSRSIPMTTASAHRAQSTHFRSSPSLTIDPQPVISTPAATTPSMAMDLSQARHINHEEKKRRQEKGLCLYCAADDHFAKFCPNKKTLASMDLVGTSLDADYISFTLGGDETV